MFGCSLYCVVGPFEHSVICCILVGNASKVHSKPSQQVDVMHFTTGPYCRVLRDSSVVPAVSHLTSCTLNYFLNCVLSQKAAGFQNNTFHHLYCRPLHYCLCLMHQSGSQKQEFILSWFVRKRLTLRLDMTHLLACSLNSAKIKMRRYSGWIKTETRVRLTFQGSPGKDRPQMTPSSPSLCIVYLLTTTFIYS